MNFCTLLECSFFVCEQASVQYVDSKQVSAICTINPLKCFCLQFLCKYCLPTFFSFEEKRDCLSGYLGGKAIGQARNVPGTTQRSKCIYMAIRAPVEPLNIGQFPLENCLVSFHGFHICSAHVFLLFYNVHKKKRVGYSATEISLPLFSNCTRYLLTVQQPNQLLIQRPA